MKILFLLICSFFLLKNVTFAQATIIMSQGNLNYLKDDGWGYADDLNCSSYANCNFEVQLNNSFLGDSIKVITNGGSSMNVFINTSGDPTFNLNSSEPNFFSLSSGYGSQNDISNLWGPTIDIMMYSNIYKIIAPNHGDTIYVNNYGDYVYNVPVPNCTFELVNGTVFIDNNNDCIYNAGDNSISTQILMNNEYTIGQRTYGMYANPNFYGYNIKANDFISGTIGISSVYNFAFLIPSCTTPLINITSLPATGIQMPRQCAADIDVLTGIGVSGIVRPMIPFFLCPKVANIGCDAASGTMKLVLDPNVTYNPTASSNPATSISGDTLIWNYSNLTNVGNSTGYWNQFFSSLELTPTLAVNVGDFLTFEIFSDIPSNDINPANNYKIITIPVVNSYDPNTKEVSPKGIGNEGFISAATQKLTYTINFQNTGTAEAINIHITDTLEGNVLPNTLRILNNSHAMTPTWLSNNVVDFKFTNIYLPDSNTNEPLSHGFVTFEIDMLPNLSPGTEIKNTAYIYFDWNDAIITNTALNTIEYPAGLSQLAESHNNGLKVLVYPNPTSSIANFSIQNADVKNALLNVYDITGKIVYSSEKLVESKITMNCDELKQGVYLYEIQDKNSSLRANGRLMID